MGIFYRKAPIRSAIVSCGLAWLIETESLELNVLST